MGDKRKSLDFCHHVLDREPKNELLEHLQLQNTPPQLGVSGFEVVHLKKETCSLSG